AQVAVADCREMVGKRRPGGARAQRRGGGHSHPKLLSSVICIAAYLSTLGSHKAIGRTIRTGHAGPAGRWPVAQRLASADLAPTEDSVTAQRPRLSVIGTGYLGATHAVCMVELGYEVIGLDVDADKIARLAAGEVPFFEPGLAELLT